VGKENEYWNVGCEELILVRVLHSELSKLDFDVVALQGTQLGGGTQKFDNFTFFNSGSESKKHEFGCGFYVRENFL
jgi:hypothetical protein